MSWAELSEKELSQHKSKLQDRYAAYCDQGLSLDLTRGKPSAEQLDLSDSLDGILQGFYLLQDGTDVRNYGGMKGIPEARQLGAEILGTLEDQILVGGNSSLQLMYLYVDFALNHAEDAWIHEAMASGSKVKFLCPVPGYDRHFKICEQLDIEMINVPLTEKGPDMETVQQLVERDPLIKGIWCIPRYSNPTGQTYSEDTVQALSALPLTAGRDFRILWDNAYAVHHLTPEHPTLLNIMEACDNNQSIDHVIQFASTSKITFAGAGISFMAASELNLEAFERYLSGLTIGFDKVNQLRHVRFLKNKEHLTEHMEKHAALIKPKFELVDEILSTSLSGKNIAHWTNPVGGYFVSLETLPGLADKVIDLASDAGVKLTPAGSTYPYGFDPANSNIRIAPTYPPVNQLRQALEVLVTCIQLASVNHFLGK